MIHVYPCCLTLAQRRSPPPTNEASAPRSSNSNWRPAARSSRTATSSRSHSRRDRSHLAPPKTHTMAASDPASRFARRASRAPERATRPKLPTHTNELVGDGPVRALSHREQSLRTSARGDVATLLRSMYIRHRPREARRAAVFEAIAIVAGYCPRAAEGVDRARVPGCGAMYGGRWVVTRDAEALCGVRST